MAELTIRPARVRDYRYQYQDDRDQGRYRPAFLFLDLETGEAGLDWDPEVGYAVPEEVWHGRVQRWDFDPEVSRDGARKMLRRVRPLLQRALDSAELEWNSQGAHIGGIDCDIYDEIAELVSSFDFQD